MQDGLHGLDDECGVGPRWKACVGRTLDLAKLLPSLIWGGMSCVAFPAYMKVGWKTPMFLSVLSTAIAIAFAYEVLMFHRRFKYVVAGEYLLGWNQVKSDFPRVKLAVAALLLVICVGLSILLLYTYHAYIKPCDASYNDGYTKGKKVGNVWVRGHGTDNSTPSCPSNLRPAPCGGACEQCPQDPDCRQWTTFMTEQEVILSICPPARYQYESDVTFSCAADGGWMLCTAFIVLLWIGSLVMTARRVGRARAESNATLVGSGPHSTEMQLMPVLRSSRPDIGEPSL